jgi:SAM-dependent methyltransferase
VSTGESLVRVSTGPAARVRRVRDRAVSWARRLVLTVPVPQTRARRAKDAAAYWSESSSEVWLADSHVKGGVPGWELIGREHHEYFLDFARAIGADPRPERVLEWGAGGGANAVVFAPEAREFIAVDVSEAALEECVRQVADVCDTPVSPVLVPVDRPDAASAHVSGQVDLFLCFYVVELLPSRHHARLVMEEAARLLRPGGLAVVQVKYQTRSPLTRSRTWAYRRGVASMVTFPVEEFWTLAVDCGFAPHSVRLVPRNHLDERYAYYFLVRS